MIMYKTGDLFKEDVDALVNSVNCVGVMGRGIALEFKKLFPENFKAYAEACGRNEVVPGRMFTFETGQMTKPRYIINFPTKRHWRGKSRMEDIESGLEALAGEIRERNIQSIAIPPLGSNLGGLNWADVRSRITEALEDIEDVAVIVFEVDSAPADGRPNRSTRVPKMTSGRAALVGLMHQYLRGELDPFATPLLAVHKLLYFLQEAGEPLRLRFAKATYGPYAKNLRLVLNSMEGHLISGYADAGDSPGEQLQIVPGALQDATTFLARRRTTKKRLERVAQLIDGFESPFGLELLSTVHWVVKEDPSATEAKVINDTYAWGPRKRQFSEHQISLALQILSERGWIEKV